MAQVPIVTTTMAQEAPATRGRGEIAGNRGMSKEAATGLVTGVAYGLTSPIVGHPFDTIKTKMQAEKIYAKSNAFQVGRAVYASQGIAGFWKGILPPLAGSAFYRGILFSTYSATFAASKGTVLEKPIPGTNGLRPAVLVGAFNASVARAAIETPLELMKVRRQTGQSWATGKGVSSMFSLQQVGELYKGSGPTFARTLSMLGSFFIIVDYSARLIPDVVNTPLVGPFFKGGIATTFGWVMGWPFETVKSRVQADTTGEYKGQSIAKILRSIIAKEGLKGMYRGIGPGATRSFVANGCSMIVFHYAQDWVEHHF